MTQIRVLQVVGAMNPGGVETWLMHVMRHCNRRKLQMEFLVHTDVPAAYDAELQSLGGRIHSCPFINDSRQYARQFFAIIRRAGPFDVIHSHVHHFSGFVLSLADAIRVPNRISHSHTARTCEGVSLLRKGYLTASRWLIAATCTRGLAASAMAATELYGREWRNDQRFEVLPCGIDLEAFRVPVDRESVRSEFGFGPGDLVIGHVGRFDQFKNHAFLVDIGTEIIRRRPDARLLLVGDGPLRRAIEERVKIAGIGDRTVFTGNRSDVARLMRGAMDRFLFPSVREGLGLALIEAQAAGLPSIVSDVIPLEADVVPALITRLSLLQAAETWAECAISAGEYPQESAWAELEASPFNLTTSTKRLENVYGL